MKKIIIPLIIILIALWLVFRSKPAAVPVDNTNVSTSTTGETTDGLSSFTDSTGTFTIMYPKGFILTQGSLGSTTDWRLNATTSGQLLGMITVPKSYMPGTNFSEAKMTLGRSSDPKAIKSCLVESTGNPANSSSVKIKGLTFTKLTYNDAGAGNFYETTSYRAILDGDCYTLEYTIHSTNIGNYPPELGIKEFDKTKIQTALENIINSFTFHINSN